MSTTPTHATGRRSPARQTGEPIAPYVDPRGCQREIVTLQGAHGSRLVIDRIAGTHGDERLIAHLCGDEPPERGVPGNTVSEPCGLVTHGGGIRVSGAGARA